MLQVLMRALIYRLRMEDELENGDYNSDSYWFK